jgi:hypothetical protein
MTPAAIIAETEADGVMLTLTPAASNRPEPRNLLVDIIMAERSPPRSSAHCATTATRLNAPHITKYPAMNAVVAERSRCEGAFGPASSARASPFRVTAACNSTMGAALGSIIAIIMSHHIENMRSA